MSFETIAIIGLGYIGLPTAAMFAAHGLNVIGIDTNEDIVDVINQGKIHIVEPELGALVNQAVRENRLRAVLIPEPADAFLIAVPTPFLPPGPNKSDIPEPDLSYIKAAVAAIAPVLRHGNLVILESTSPVGTTQKIAEWLAEARNDLTFPKTNGDQSDIHIAYCPERVLPGHIICELTENDRLIGGLTERCSEYAIALYRHFVQGECIITDARTAEMAKLTENSFRDVNIAFANELSIICDKLDINVWKLIELANRHPRVNILQPGPGVGGHCIAVDPWFIVSKTPEQARLIQTARQVNDGKPSWVVEKVKRAIEDFLHANPVKTARDVTVACFGLTFKANIDDLRESPSIIIAEGLIGGHSGRTVVVEPNISKLPPGILKNAELVSINNGITADIIVILVAHFAFNVVRSHFHNSKCVIDATGLFST